MHFSPFDPLGPDAMYELMVSQANPFVEDIIGLLELPELCHGFFLTLLLLSRGVGMKLFGEIVVALLQLSSRDGPREVHELEGVDDLRGYAELVGPRLGGVL